MPNEAVLIDVLNIDPGGTDFQKCKSVYAAIVRIVRLRPIVHPLHRNLRLVARRVVGETSITKTDRLDSHVFLISDTEMLVSPDPTVELFGIEKGFDAAQQMTGVSVFIS